jgi:hypothetical protein
MDYQYENLGPERFQEFCQSLLVRTFPKLRCFPVGQPDGGRDAITYELDRTLEDFIVFQVKYVRKPLAESDAHKKLTEAVKGEIPKIKTLIQKGAKEYFLLTNIPGTAHLDVGSIDQIKTILTENLDIPATCWWRDDLNRRLDNAWQLKWTYPELLSGIDMLQHIIQSRLGENKKGRMDTIKAFVRDQYIIDEEVRFKQIELQNKLLDLFVDVPVTTHSGYSDRLQRRFYNYIAHKLTSHKELEEYGSYDIDDDDGSVRMRRSFFERGKLLGAATLFLYPDFQKRSPNVVLEGAPGQGKSTIVQYVCQIHRMRILNEPNILESIPEFHKATMVRIPFKVDLRDLATWLGKRDPFSSEEKDDLPKDWHKSLEAFLAAQVRHHSGGLEFSVDDLIAISKWSAILIVLDGLDEVADISKRQEIVKEVIAGIARLEENASSLQTIITSRPAAFANSPGFPEKQFPHYELSFIDRDIIEEYANKWLKAKRLFGRREGAEVRKILKDKLDQPHLRDLARNPMQLAILLSLIHTRGVSLPDKRTALYDSYMELFFNREAEKSVTVRKHRDLLIDIHQYLAWILHSEAETGNTRGSISNERLHQLLRDCLEVEERDPNIANDLFAGMVERVVALVSRVQGTYEFEVQPLREYFAARYLYETAPYSPPGAEAGGTKPDRFDAMARDFSWLNVTRFYAGCYSKGELPSLTDCLSNLIQENGYRFINHPRTLAATLLSDWVFTQHQKSMKQVVSMILDGLGLWHISASRSKTSRLDDVFILPQGCGRNELIETCFETLHTYPASDYARELINLIRANSPKEEFTDLWLSHTNKTTGENRTKWIEYGLYLGLLSNLSLDKIDDLISDDPQDRSRYYALFRAERFDFFSSSEERAEIIINYILARDIVTHGQQRGLSILGLFVHAIDPRQYEIAFQMPSQFPLSDEPRRFGYANIFVWEELSTTRETIPTHPFFEKCAQVVAVARQESQRFASHWASSLEPWDSIIEKSRSIFGDRWAHFHMANISSGIKSRHVTCKEFPDLFDHSLSLCRRTRYARLRAGTTTWWQKQFEAASTELEIMFATLVLLSWGSARTISQLAELVSNNLNKLPYEDWLRLARSFYIITSQRSENCTIDPISIKIDSLPSNISERFVSLVALRLREKFSRAICEKYLFDYQGNDPVTLNIYQTTAIDLLLDPNTVNWQHQIEAIKKSYQYGTISEPYRIRLAIRLRYDEVKDFKLEIAQEIAKNPQMFPNYLVSLAEQRCKMAVAATIIPVGEIAKRENWFNM